MLSDTFRKLLQFAWFLPGFLLWAAYPPMGERTDVLFALAPLMWLGRREPNVRVVAKRWFQSGVFYWVATLSWMPAIVKNGGPWPLVVLGWFALAAYCALYFAAYGWLSAAYWRWARRPRSGAATLRTGGRYGWRLAGVLFVEPLLWCGLELVRSRLFGGFAWNQLGVVPVNSGFGAPAALGGVYLCSAVVVLINGTIAGIAERMWKPERSGFANLRRLGVLETVLAFALVFGIYRCSRPFVAVAGSRPLLSVALVQRNLPCCFQPQEGSPYAIYGRLIDNVASLKPDLVVLAESALCEFGPVDQQGAADFARWVAGRTGASLLAGGTRHADGRTYNSAALYVPSSGSLSVYDKVHLVPFGEYIPGDKLFPALQQLAPVGSCTPGELKTLALPTDDGGRVELGVAICFEDTDSAQLRELARKGAEALCFITNDSWFSGSIEAEQHAWQAVARAIETGLPVVRVGNSGVSGTIAPDGRATWLPGEDGRPLVARPGTMFDRIPAGSGRTAYVAVGDAPTGIAFALLISSMILVKYRNCHEYGNQA